MKVSKAIIPLVATLAFGAFTAKRIKSRKSSNEIFKSAVDAVEKTFGGLKQSLIDELVSNIHKGVKAVIIEKDKLEYSYMSNSGKNVYSSILELDSSGKISIDRGYYGGGFPPNAPAILAKKLIEKMKIAKKNV